MIVFPLIWVGGLVTTFDAGMAVPDWPGTYGYNMFLYPLETWFFGPFDLFVEHGHRLLASTAGLVAIALVVVTYRSEPRRSVRWLAVAILLLVIFQGVLGGLRVRLDARVLAKLHGCVGPAFFAAVVAYCVVTSRWWWRQTVGGSGRSSDEPAVKASGLVYWSMLMLAMSFGQLVLGAFVRHISVSSLPSVYRSLVVMHMVTAAVLVLGTLVQWGVLRLARFRGLGVRGSANALMGLILVQVFLGVCTWVVKFGWPVWFASQEFAASYVVGEKTLVQMNLITAHVAVGSLILVVWTIQMLRCHCLFGRGQPLSRRSAERFETQRVSGVAGFQQKHSL